MTIKGALASKQYICSGSRKIQSRFFKKAPLTLIHVEFIENLCDTQLSSNLVKNSLKYKVEKLIELVSCLFHFYFATF